MQSSLEGLSRTHTSYRALWEDFRERLPPADSPVEGEDLPQLGIDRVVRDVSSTSTVSSIVNANVTVDVQDAAPTAWAVVVRSDAKGIAVGVFPASDGTPNLATCPCLCELALEVVQGVLAGFDVAVKLIIATIVNCSQRKGISAWNSETESDLAVLPVLAGGYSRSRLGTELIECDGDGGLVGAKGVTGGARRASGSVQPQGGDIERARSGLLFLKHGWGGEGAEDKRGDDRELHCLGGHR